MGPSRCVLSLRFRSRSPPTSPRRGRPPFAPRAGLRAPLLKRPAAAPAALAACSSRSALAFARRRPPPSGGGYPWGSCRAATLGYTAGAGAQGDQRRRRRRRRRGGGGRRESGPFRPAQVVRTRPAVGTAVAPAEDEDGISVVLQHRTRPPEVPSPQRLCPTPHRHKKPPAGQPPTPPTPPTPPPPEPDGVVLGHPLALVVAHTRRGLRVRVSLPLQGICIM